MTEPLNIRASLRAEIDNPLALDFDRREKDGVPHANNPKNVRISLFRLGFHAARSVDASGEVYLVGPHPNKPGEIALFRLTKERISNLRLDIHRRDGFLPSKTLVKDVIEDVARAFDVKWTQERGLYVE